MKKPIRYLSLCGLLGYGYSLVSLKNALEREVGEMDYNLSILHLRMEVKTAQ